MYDEMNIFLLENAFSHRAEHRARGARQQGVRRPSYPEDAALDSLQEVRRSHDRVQPNADRLSRAMQGPDPATARNHRTNDYQ